MSGPRTDAPGRRRPGPALLVVAAALAAALALAPGPVSAHATLLSAAPQPGSRLATGPGVVVLTFSEALNIHLSRAEVTAPGGRLFVQASVSRAEIRVPVTTDAPGLYDVSWTSVSALDGHTLSGGYQFGVDVSPAGAATEGTAAPGSGDLVVAGLRALEYGALLLAVGMLLLGTLAGRAPPLTWVRWPLPAALAAAGLGGLGVVLGEALAATGSPAPAAVLAYLTATAGGWTRLARLAGEALAAAVALRRPRAAALPLVAALGALAAAGHAAAARPPALGLAATLLHLVSAGLWAGGILALALQRPPGGWLGRQGRGLLSRFTPVALAAFPVTVLTGLLQGTEELGGLRDLVASTYGEVLALKGLAVLLMVPLSVLAWRRVRPAPRLEAAVALVVIGASALLAAFPLPPARLQEAQAAQAGPQAALALPGPGDLTLAAGAGDVLVGLTLRPGLPGVNSAWLYVLPVDGEQAAGGLAVTLAVDGRTAPVRRCGPACREAGLRLGGGERLTVDVRGRDGGTATFPVPPLPAAPALDLVQQAERRMSTLSTVRLDETLRPAAVPLDVTYAFQAPDRLAYQIGDGAQAVIVGGTRYSRDTPRARWQAEPVPPVPVPTYVWDGAPALAARSLGTADEDGRPERVVAFFERQSETPVWFRLWVDGQGLVRRAEMTAQAHFMVDRYRDFDAPLTIVPPG